MSLGVRVVILSIMKLCKAIEFTKYDKQMKKLKKNLPCGLLLGLLCVPLKAVCADAVSQSIDIYLTTNITPPVCRLNMSEQTIDFGEFSIFDISRNNVSKAVKLSFSDCASVNDITISFTGSTLDTSSNCIRNKLGKGNASGVVIKLYDDKNKEIQLKEKIVDMSIDKNTSLDYLFNAKIVQDDSTTYITPGLISTSVDLNITYS